MPRLSCWFIKSSLIYLVLGFTFGGLLLAHKGLSLHPTLWLLLSPHIELLLIGWLLQLAMGVAFWILPRFGKGRPRGDERIAWAAFITLNLGIWLVVFSIWPSLNFLAVFGRFLETSGALAFIVVSWKRIKPFKIP